MSLRKYRHPLYSDSIFNMYKHFWLLGELLTHHTLQQERFAQHAKNSMFGTTHADHFNGPIPVTRSLQKMRLTAITKSVQEKIIAERLHRWCWKYSCISCWACAFYMGKRCFLSRLKCDRTRKTLTYATRNVTVESEIFRITSVHSQETF